VGGGRQIRPRPILPGIHQIGRTEVSGRRDR
jgi:hypothetical protein